LRLADRALSASCQARRSMWRGSRRRKSPDTRLVPQPPNPHFRRLSMSEATLHHVIRWSVELKDYYFILGVPRTATARDILHAYRALAKLYHPDRVGPQGTATFQ